jgi:tryptophanase
VSAPASPTPSPERTRHLGLLAAALAAVVAARAPRERLRLACYYAQGLTLAEIGRLLGEHEATVSRQLAKTRQGIRRAVEQRLREEAHLDEAAIADCIASAADDPGDLSLADWLEEPSARKISPSRRSTSTSVP